MARLIIAAYVVWKTVWYDWGLFIQTPFSLAAGAYRPLIPPGGVYTLTVEKWVLILTMAAFAVGYRLLLSSYIGAALLGHLTAIRFTLNPGGGTTALFIATWFIIFFGLFHDQDGLSVDLLRNDLNSLSAMNRFLKSGPDETQMYPLKWSLTAIALVYFGAGFQKAIQGPLLEWATAENLSRTIVMMNTKVDVLGGLGPYLVEYQLLMLLGAWSTIFLELGFLAAVLLGLSVTPFLIGIMILQLVIGISMGPFFFDVIVLFLIFLSWDSLLEAASTDEHLRVVYDEHCYFCARSLLLFKLLDVRGNVTFQSQYDAPDWIRQDESIDLESAMYAFEDGDHYRGYFAFKQLLSRYGIFSWLVWLMDIKPIAAIGQRCYEYIASNRSRYFTCNIEPGE